MLRIALASPPFTGSTGQALEWVEKFIAEAAAREAQLVCFPETFIPGLRGLGFAVEEHDPARLRAARERVCALAAERSICVIMPMEWPSEAGGEGIVNTAFVINANGEIDGQQAKVQLAPEEDPFYVPGARRDMFEVNGVPFGVAICHEGWRYPETVRWAARRGAPIVFQPNFAGSASEGPSVKNFGAADSPYYEKAMVCRSLENSIYFASVNYALDDQHAATAVISPAGECIAHAPYGKPHLLVTDIDPGGADRLYAQRLRPM